MFRLRSYKARKSARQEINVLKEKFKTVELQPCYGDADLRKKENDLLILWKEIYSLEKEIDHFAFPVLKTLRLR